MPVMRIEALKDARRIPVHGGADFGDIATKRFDLATDAAQAHAIDEPQIAARLEAIFVGVLIDHDAPAEICSRTTLASVRRHADRTEEKGLGNERPTSARKVRR